MTVEAVGAIGSEAAQAASKTSQIAQQVNAQPAQATNVTEIPMATLQMPEKTVSSLGGPESFGESVLDNVYSEIDRLSSKVPNVSGEGNAVDQAMKGMASDKEIISPMAEPGLESAENEAINRLSNAFDHAIFMALVNQAISGVSDTSRTLIRQS